MRAARAPRAAVGRARRAFPGAGARRKGQGSAGGRAPAERGRPAGAPRGNRVSAECRRLRMGRSGPPRPARARAPRRCAPERRARHGPRLGRGAAAIA